MLHHLLCSYDISLFFIIRVLMYVISLSNLFITSRKICSLSSDEFHSYNCQSRSHNCEKQLLASLVGMFVCPSICIEQLGTCWTDFNYIWYLNTFPKSLEKIHVPLISHKKIVYCYIIIYYHSGLSKLKLILFVWWYINGLRIFSKLLFSNQHFWKPVGEYSNVLFNHVKD
jgi:hypothetical protein